MGKKQLNFKDNLKIVLANTKKTLIKYSNLNWLQYLRLKKYSMIFKKSLHVHISNSFTTKTYIQKNFDPWKYLMYKLKGGFNVQIHIHVFNERNPEKNQKKLWIL